MESNRRTRNSKSASEPVARPGWVLVVDDEDGPRQALSFLLEREYRVTSAETIAQGIEAVSSHPIDVVVLDLLLPGLKEGQSVRAIREAAPNVEIVVVTGFESYTGVVQALRHGAFDWITKPFASRDVIDTVARAMARRHARETRVRNGRIRDIAIEVAAEVQALRSKPKLPALLAEIASLQILCDEIRSRVDADAAA